MLVLPDWEEKCRRIGENPNNILEAGRATSESSETASICLVVVWEANRNLEYRQCTSVGAKYATELIDARYLEWSLKVIAADCQHHPGGAEST